MPSTIKVPTLYDALKERREKLSQNLTRLANAQYTLVKHDHEITEDDFPRAIITSLARVRRTDYLFSVWEDFRDFDGFPYLYGFTYSLIAKDRNLEPLFRYECHPDTADTAEENQDAKRQGEVSSAKRNPYGDNPHFHPNKALSHPISRLHYPFQRAERTGVVFALIAWIETDLVVRFYDSGRIKAAS